MLGPWEVAEVGRTGRVILSYTRRQDSTTGKNCWTKGDPQPESDLKRGHSYHQESS